MIEEALKEIAESCEEFTQETMDEQHCKITECFPFVTNRVMHIDGKEYVLHVDISLKGVCYD